MYFIINSSGIGNISARADSSIHYSHHCDIVQVECGWLSCYSSGADEKIAKKLDNQRRRMFALGSLNDAVTNVPVQSISVRLYLSRKKKTKEVYYLRRHETNSRRWRKERKEKVVYQFDRKTKPTTARFMLF